MSIAPGTCFSISARPSFKFGVVLSLRGTDVLDVAALGNLSGAEAMPLTAEDWGFEKLEDIQAVDLSQRLSVRLDEITLLRSKLSERTVLEVLRRFILRDTRAFSKLAHRDNLPGWEKEDTEATSIPYAGRVFDGEEVERAVSSTLDFWLTLGGEGDAFEKELASFLGVKKSILVNSGSSANLVAFSSLTSHKLPPKKRIRPGDEVITCAAGFPTTVAPIIQNGAVPVFIDNDPVTGNALSSALAEAYSKGRTKAVMFAHTLGNPFDLETVISFCREHDLWLIEDNCDALGATYSMPRERALQLGFRQNSPGIPDSDDFITRYTGTWGDLSTQSFYPPHHLTMGEGGAVNIVSDMLLKVLVESFRDWGRDCWCASGKDNTCNKRFGWKLGELPEGYDHKYIYSHLGYNLKPLDPQAAIGRAQMSKLSAFVAARRDNWNYLRSGLADLEATFEFSLPTHSIGWSSDGFRWPTQSSEIYSGSRCDPSWFGFMMLIRKGQPFRNVDLARHLDGQRIGNRMLFGGNLLRQPAFVQLQKDSPDALRKVGDFVGADRLMNEAIFVGTYPGLTRRMLDRILDEVHRFVKER